MSDRPREYGEGRLPIPAIPEPTVIFIIKLAHWADTWDEVDVYRETQRAWKIGPVPRDQAVYALGVSHGVVLGAYRIMGWRPTGDRWAFDGRTATELQHVVGTSIARLTWPRAAVNPVRLYLGGIDAPGKVHQG